jgi:hypothetical protein
LSKDSSRLLRAHTPTPTRTRITNQQEKKKMSLLSAPDAVIPAAFQDALERLRAAVPTEAEWGVVLTPAALEALEAGGVEAAPPLPNGASSSSPARPPAPAAPSVGDWRVLAAMAGGAAPRFERALCRYVHTNVAAVGSPFAAAADDMIFLVQNTPTSSGANGASSIASPGPRAVQTAAEVALAAPSAITSGIRSLFKRFGGGSSASKTKSADDVPTSLSRIAPSGDENTAMAEGAEASDASQQPPTPATIAGPSHAEVRALDALAFRRHAVAGEEDVKGAAMEAMRRANVHVLRRGHGGVADMRYVASASVSPSCASAGSNTVIGEGTNALSPAWSCTSQSLTALAAAAAADAPAVDPDGAPSSTAGGASEVATVAADVWPQAVAEYTRRTLWFPTLALNLLTQWPYHLTVAVVRVLRCEALGPNPQMVAVRHVQRRVYAALDPPDRHHSQFGAASFVCAATAARVAAAHREGRDGTQIDYPDVHFRVDDFEDAFGDLRLAPTYRLAVLLVAGGSPIVDDAAPVVFRGVVGYSALAQKLREHERRTTGGGVSANASMASRSFFDAPSSLSSTAGGMGIGGGGTVVVPLRASSGRAELAVTLSDADRLVRASSTDLSGSFSARQDSTTGLGSTLRGLLGGGKSTSSSANLAASSGSPSPGQLASAASSAPPPLRGDEVLQCALTSISVHAAHVASTLMTGTPWHHITLKAAAGAATTATTTDPSATESAGKTPAISQPRDRWCVFPSSGDELSRWIGASELEEERLRRRAEEEAAERRARAREKAQGASHGHSDLWDIAERPAPIGAVAPGARIE